MRPQARRVASRWLLARLLQPPPKMVEEITEWVWAQVAATKLKVRAVSGVEYGDEAQLAAAARAGGGKVVGLREEVKRKFPVDLRGWKYGDKIDQLVRYEVERASKDLGWLKEHKEKLQAQGEWDDAKEQMYAMMRGMTEQSLKDAERQGIHVILQYLPGTKTGGEWSPAQNALFVYFRPASDRDEIYDTVYHELSHYAQELLMKVSGAASVDVFKRPGGLPPRKTRTPEWKQSPGADDWAHSLDDREFYPMLHDAVEEMRAALSKLPEEQHRDAFLMMTGQKRVNPRMVRRAIPFLRHLKSGAPGKWRKALSEAYGELF